MNKTWVVGLLLFSVQQVWSEPSTGDVLLPEIKVLGATTRSSTLDFVPTVSELSGTRLTRKKQSTLGETLARETGVTSSYFGPNASRPVIRALDGDRVRMLQNGVGVLDASSASQDHAVAIDPLTVERIEIVRGPAALLYGSQAVGGVINLVTNRVPEKVPEQFNGKAETRYSSTDDGRSAALTAGGGLGKKWAWHADLAQRAADDYHVHGYARTVPLEGEAEGRVYNSFNRTGSAAAGTSYVFSNGFIGTSFSNYDSEYGVVKEPFVYIDLSQQRWDVAAELRHLGFIQSVHFKNSFSNYKHAEVEEGQVGTTFKNVGDEARVDVRHQSWLGFSGIFGLQANTFDFSAKGEEKFLPGTKNNSLAVFFFEEKDSGPFKPSFGARLDRTSSESESDPDFGPAQERSFSLASASLGLLYQMTAADAVVLNGAYTQRAPNYQELFANGPHAATSIFEVGDVDLKKEESQSLELSWRNKSEAGQGSVGLFLQDFKDYIALSPRGAVDPGSSLDIYDYDSVSARLYGAELDYRFKLPDLCLGGATEVELKVDTVRGLNRATGDNLPRVTPIRETLAFLHKTNRFQADLEIQRSERQSHTAPNETATNDYTFLNLGLEAPVRLLALNLSGFARVNNVFNVEARNHVSFLKDEAPLPGRNFVLGLQAAF